MTTHTTSTLSRLSAAVAIAILLASHAAQGAVGADEAAKLTTTLTPTGAERAGSKDGTIPAWDGGYTTPIPGFVNGGKRGDPFAADKPLFSITGKNIDQYADKLSDGTRQMLKTYPDYRLDVYQSRRTFAAPAYIYERTAKNATTVKLVDTANGPVLGDYGGGFPFPIPTNGAEAISNHVFRWIGDGNAQPSRLYTITAEGKVVLNSENWIDVVYPANMAKPVGKDWDGFTALGRITTLAPSVQKGSATMAWSNVDSERNLVWTYLTGQRRLRKLPNPCCDTPAPNTSGTLNFDEVQLFQGSLKRYDWKLVGKKEILIPYNTNRSYVPKESEIIKGRFFSPDYLRWELHRVWVVQATLKAGQRHIAPKAMFYLDEDSWIAVLADRWDAHDQLVKSSSMLPLVAPDYPATLSFSFITYDFLSGAWSAQTIVNDQATQFKRVTDFPANHFSPDALESEGVR